ncbi:restriction endonuclease subunit S [Escherichia coli]|nr:restriction endonuclease subunit S [Escherichia coli]
MSYRKYTEYKPSGIDWVSEIPKSWEVLPAFSVVKDVCVKNVDGVEDNVLSLSYGNIVKRNLDGNAGLLPESFNTYQIVLEGNIVLRLTDLQNDKKSLRVGYVTEKGIITSAYLNLACLKRIEPRYAYFLLHSYDLTKVFYGMGGGLRQSMKFEDLKRLPIIFPPYSEQLSIVQFLDAETAKIDKLICKQSQLIELLKEKRQSVISKVATIRGDEKALKLSYCVDLLPGYAFPSSGYHFEKASNIRLLRGVNVGVDSIRWEDVVYWNVSDKIDLSAFELRENDIVIGMDRPWIAAGARVAEINKEDLPCLLLQRVARVRVNNGYYQPFIKMCLSSFEFKAFIESDLTGVSVPHLSPEQIKSFQIRNINMEQQKRETDKAVYLCNKLTEIENKAYEVIKYLTERRSALISAAVTGKIDVRNWQPDAKDAA